MGIHVLNQGVHLGQQPFVHDSQFLIIQFMLRRVEIVNVGIQHEEGVGVPQGAHELSLALLHRLAVETVGQPRSAVDIEIPADGVRAVLGQRVKRVDGISLGFGHLLSVLILDMAQHDDIFIRRLVENQCGDGKQGVEPPSCLVHRLGDEVRRELLLEQFLILKWIVMLRKWHGA